VTDVDNLVDIVDYSVYAP